MKKILPLVFILAFSHSIISQNVTPITLDKNNTTSEFAIEKINNINLMTKQSKSSFGRWYNYGETMELMQGSASTLSGNNLFPDSTILVNYGASGYSGPWIHKLGDALDVSSIRFNDPSLHPGALNLDASSFYSLDSIEFWCIYSRNINDPQIVDTLVFEISITNSVNTVFFGPGPLPTNLNSDTVFFKHIPYAYQTNTLNIPNKHTFKIPLTAQTHIDSLPNGIHIIKLATTGLPTVNPGEYIYTSVGFIPGYTWVANTDLLENNNSILFISRKQQDNQFPIYTKHDLNVSYIIPSDVRYNAAGTWNGHFIPSFAYMGGATSTYRYEHHLIYYKISTSFNIVYTTQNVSCHGASDGLINLTTVAGGTPPYTYLWSNGQTTQNIQNLSAGTYSVTITDSVNDLVMRVFNITEPQPLQANVSSTPASACGASDGSINVSSVQGGTPPYSIIVLNSDSVTQAMSDLISGIYTIKISDSKGCQLITYIAVNESGAPTVNETISHVSCFGFDNGSISLSIPSPIGTPTYVWNTGHTTSSINNLSPGIYNVTVTDASCNIYKSFTITEPSLLGVSGTVTNAGAGQTNGSIILQVTGGTPNYTYSWSSGQITPNIGNLGEGTYSVTVTDAQSCTASESFQVTVGINEASESGHFKVFPNPVSETLYISYNGNNTKCQVNVISIQGTILKSNHYDIFNDKIINLDISDIPAGFYLIEIISDNQRILNRIVK